MGTLIFNLNMMKMMKYRLLFLYILGMTVAACNNDLPDELFVKRVVIAENGFQDLRVEYPEDGTVNTQITISISGTSRIRWMIIIMSVSSRILCFIIRCYLKIAILWRMKEK